MSNNNFKNIFFFQLTVKNDDQVFVMPIKSTVVKYQSKNVKIQPHAYLRRAILFQEFAIKILYNKFTIKKDRINKNRRKKT